MKVWYQAVCEKHKQSINVMVTNPTQTSHYLGEHSEKIQEWLETHYGCELKLAWRDDHLDHLFEDGYSMTKLT